MALGAQPPPPPPPHPLLRGHGRAHGVPRNSFSGAGRSAAPGNRRSTYSTPRTISSCDEDAILRIYFDDGTWSTLEGSERCTAKHICSSVVRRRRLDADRPCVLTLVHCFDGNQFKRTLNSHECPLVVMEALKKHRRLGSARLVFRQEDCSNDDATLLGERCGYLDRQCGRHRVWTRRWVVLSGGKLFCFKSPQDSKVRDSMSLSDSFVRIVPQTSSAGTSSDSTALPVVSSSSSPAPCSLSSPSANVFQIVKSDGVFLFRAYSQLQLVHWVTDLQKHCVVDAVPNRLLDWAQDIIDDAETEKADAREQLLSHLSTIESVVMHQTAFEVLLHYLTERHCEEGLMFWHAVHQFKSSSLSEEQSGVVAQAIFDDFIEENADREIPVSCSIRNQIRQNLHSCPLDTTLFDTLQKETLSHLDQANFVEFRLSPEFYHLLECLSINSLHNASECDSEASLSSMENICTRTEDEACMSRTENEVSLSHTEHEPLLTYVASRALAWLPTSSRTAPMTMLDDKHKGTLTSRSQRLQIFSALAS